MAKQRHIEHLVDRYLKGTCSRTELKELLSLLNEAEHDESVRQQLDAFWGVLSRRDLENRLGDDEVDTWFDEIFSEARHREDRRDQDRFSLDLPADVSGGLPGDAISGGADSEKAAGRMNEDAAEHVNEKAAGRASGSHHTVQHRQELRRQATGSDRRAGDRGVSGPAAGRVGEKRGLGRNEPAGDELTTRRSTPTGKQGMAKRRAGSPFWKVAAILLVTLGLSWAGQNWFQQQTTVETEVVYQKKVVEAGEKMRFMLPDGTQVHLNAASELRYPETFGESDRRVYLSGEAFFVVARDEERPFVVESDRVTTEVLGTSFSFRAYPDDEQAIVAVTQGRVAVSENAESLENAESPEERREQSDGEQRNGQLVLTAGQWAGYEVETRQFSSGEGNLSEFTDWNDGVLRYHDRRLEEVVRQLERWYGVTIEFTDEKLGECIIQGEHRNEILDNVLNAITYAFDMDYQIDGRHVVIRGDGCQ